MLPGNIQCRTGKPSRVTARPTITCGASPPAVLRVAPPAKPPRGLPARRRRISTLPVLALDAILLVDLEVQRGGVVEDQLHIQVQQVRHAEVKPLLKRLLVRLQEVHRPIQMMHLQSLAALDPHVLREPLLVAVELRRGRAGAIGHHGEQRPLDGELDLALAGELGDEIGQSHPAPEPIEDVHVAIGPGIGNAHGRVPGHQVLGRAAFEDAVGEPAQALGGGGIVAASAVVDDAHARALLDGVPDALGDLEVAEDGAVGALLV